jgi:hypothetical protein
MAVFKMIQQWSKVRKTANRVISTRSLLQMLTKKELTSRGGEKRALFENIEDIVLSKSESNCKEPTRKTPPMKKRDNFRGDGGAAPSGGPTS